MKWQTLGPDIPRSGNAITMGIARIAMHLAGWRIEGEVPNEPKLIIAVAPHSSNFDFLLTVLVIWGLGLRASYLAKQSLFRFPLGIVMRYFGGIPVDRASANGLVEQMTERFGANSQLILGITPEGTRSQVKRWKNGFALIAQAADVPVLPSIIDYEHRVVRFHPLIDDVQDARETLTIVQQAAKTGAPRRGS